MKLQVLNRKVHYWLSVIIGLPLLVVICSGLLLQLKKQLTWVQPAEKRGVGTVPELSFDEILRVASSVSHAKVASWDDVNRLDVRPGRGMVKVWAKSNWEIQIDSRTGEILQTAYRRSDLIESIHDGSFFSDIAKYGLFFPAGVGLLILWITGIYLFVLPYLARARRPARARITPTRE